MKTYQTEPVKNLPDKYRKDQNSNNFKILEIERIAVNDLRKDSTQIDDILDIDNAYGKTLDRYGERVGQERGRATDAQYVLMIKAKIMTNLSNGSHKSIVDAICRMLKCGPSQVYIADSNRPCIVRIFTLPLASIITAGFTSSQIAALIKRLLPAGVSLETFLFEGTFEFSAVENEYNVDKGFSDVENGTIGGFLGITSGEESEELLPI